MWRAYNQWWWKGSKTLSFTIGKMHLIDLIPSTVTLSYPEIQNETCHRVFCLAFRLCKTAEYGVPYYYCQVLLSRHAFTCSTPTRSISSLRVPHFVPDCVYANDVICYPPVKVRNADIVVSAAGRAGLVKGHWIRPGAVVVDVAMNTQGPSTIILSREMVVFQ